MRTIKLLLALTLFGVAATLFLRLVEGIALTSSLVILSVLALTGVALSFTGLPKRLGARKSR